MINLSEAQKEIVNSPFDMAIQVLASAGSGKTRVLTERARYILKNTKKEGVIALTFTNKAAEEMLSRLEGEEGLEKRTWITTVHAVAKRILEQYGHAIGLPSELHVYERDHDRKTVFLQSLHNNGLDVDAFLNVADPKTRKNRQRTIQKYMERFSVIKRELLSEAEIKERFSKNPKFFNIYLAYQSSLLESGGIDFDDILVYAHRILLEQPWCGRVYRARYKHVCVDEAQDLNKAQYEFIKALCGDQIKSILMVGDPNQMIYGFNGSSHDYLCQKFVQDFDPLIFELKENYRSSSAVIHLANKLNPGSQIESSFVLSGRSHVEALSNEEEEANWVCNKIVELTQEKDSPEIEGNINLSNMVVIARNRFVFFNIESCLQKKNIPYSLKKSERQLEPFSTFGKILDLGIRLRLNSKDWVDGKKLCSILKIDFPTKWGSDDLLLKFSSASEESEIPFPELQSKLLKSLHDLNVADPNLPKLYEEFRSLIESLGHNIQSNSDDSANDELERSLQELIYYKNCWTNFKKRGLGDTLSAFRNSMALGQLTDDFNPVGLTLSTVHTMKGLEKDIVFLIGMCEGVFPDYRSTSPAEIQEERNNAFVAVTRARRWIYITYPKKRKMPWGDIKLQKPSRFVVEMEK